TDQQTADRQRQTERRKLQAPKSENPTWKIRSDRPRGAALFRRDWRIWSRGLRRYAVMSKLFQLAAPWNDPRRWADESSTRRVTDGGRRRHLRRSQSWQRS